MVEPPLEELWEDVPPAPVFDASRLAGVPPLAHRYLERTFAAGALVPSAVRLWMHGEIRLGGHWRTFEAEQVSNVARGFVWRAVVRLGPAVYAKGWDALVDGRGEMRWRALGVVPIAEARGPDVDRSARGRFHGESVWLPSALLDPTVRWEERPAGAIARLRTGDVETALALDLTPAGELVGCRFDRWGNPGGGAFGLGSFGGSLGRPRTFARITVPTSASLGWDGDDFFRVAIDEAIFR